MSKLLKLYWGENYSPKPEKVVVAIKKAVQQSQIILNQYPGQILDETIKALALHYNFDPKQIIIGNGIEGLIHLIARTYINNQDKVKSLNPTFPLYKDATVAYGGNYQDIKININQKIHSIQLIPKIKDSKLFFLASPNSLTGHYAIDIEEIEKILSLYSGIFTVDECYFGVGNKTVARLINKYQNIIVLRSFSKSMGLAGLRFGYAFSDEKNINKLKKWSQNIETDQINIFACLIAKTVLPYAKVLAENYLIFKKDFINHLAEIKNIDVIPTDTTFILIRIKYKKAKDIYCALKDKYKIIIKDTGRYDNFDEDMLMFAVPEKQDWEYFITSLKKALEIY